MSTTIFAPHVDDETIGCWKWLSKRRINHVVYFFDITDERRAEAYNAANRFGFEPHFYGQAFKIKDQTTHLLLPSIHDAHPDHKLVNRVGRAWAKKGTEFGFYGVDMNHRFQKLSPEESFGKMVDLKELYPSQAALWTNEKYWLFESYSVSEYVITKTFLLKAHVIEVSSYLDASTNINHAYLDAVETECEGKPHEFMNQLVKYFDDSTIKIKLVAFDGDQLEFTYG